MSHPQDSLPSLNDLAAEAFNCVAHDQAADLVRKSQMVRYRDHEDFFRGIRRSEERFRAAANQLRNFLRKYRHCTDRPTRLTTVQSARICAFENEKGFIFVSAAIIATIIGRSEGDSLFVIEPNIPVFWISERDMIEVVGSVSWDSVIHRLGYSLLSISFADWSEERLLATIRQTFPNAELQHSPIVDETNSS